MQEAGDVSQGCGRHHSRRRRHRRRRRRHRRRLHWIVCLFVWVVGWCRTVIAIASALPQWSLNIWCLITCVSGSEMLLHRQGLQGSWWWRQCWLEIHSDELQEERLHGSNCQLIFPLQPSAPYLHLFVSNCWAFKYKIAIQRPLPSSRWWWIWEVICFACGLYKLLASILVSSLLLFSVKLLILYGSFQLDVCSYCKTMLVWFDSHLLHELYSCFSPSNYWTWAQFWC